MPTGFGTLKAEAEAKGVKVATEIADLSTEAGINAGIDKALGPFGGILDVLVNNVGIGFVRTFDEVTDAEWDRTMQLNFMSAVRACRKVLPILRTRPGSVIINNASDLARQPEPVSDRLFGLQGRRAGVDQGSRAVGGTTYPRQRGRARSGLDTLLDETRRLRRDHGQVPQDGAAEGGRARIVAAPVAARPPWQARGGRQRHRVHGLGAGQLRDVGRLGASTAAASAAII